MIRTGSLSDLLKDSEKVREPIMDRIKNLQEDMNKRVPFNTEDIKNDLSNELTQFQEYVINLSQRCLSKLNEWNDTLIGMDTEINEYSGVIQRTKSEMGTRLITPILCEGRSPIQQPLDDVLYSEQQFAFPTYSFNINLQVLNKVGHQAIESNTDPEVANQPLITKTNVNDSQPLFWSLQTDLFTPTPEVASSLDQNVYKTSFSEFYGFNPQSGGQANISSQSLETIEPLAPANVDIDDDSNDDEKSDSDE